MTMMISEIYKALKDSTGVSEEKTRKAAEAPSQVENRFSNLESDMVLLKWMVGTLYPPVVAILLKVLLD